MIWDKYMSDLRRARFVELAARLGWDREQRGGALR